MTAEEAAEAVVKARRALTAATQRADSARWERQTPADRTRAEQAQVDYQRAEGAHRLAVDRLRAVLPNRPATVEAPCPARNTAGVEAAARKAGELRALMEESAALWLADFLTSKGGVAEVVEAKLAGRAAGYSEEILRRARHRLNVNLERRGADRWWWSLPS